MDQEIKFYALLIKTDEIFHYEIKTIIILTIARFQGPDNSTSETHLVSIQISMLVTCTGGRFQPDAIGDTSCDTHTGKTDSDETCHY